MPSEFLVRAGESRRILRLVSSSVPGSVRFHAEAVDGSAPTGTITLERLNWFTRKTERLPLAAENVLDKGFGDADYSVTVTPDTDTRILFQTRHARAGILLAIILAVVGLAVISGITAALTGPPAG